MKIIVTGGTGYIGSHTVVELQQDGHEVVIVDNLANSTINVLDGIQGITGTRPAFEKIDLTDRPATLDFFARHKDARAVIHFAALKAVGLGDRLMHKSNQMSGGQMQRVAIARALVNNPAVILADEATGNLDTRTSFEVLVLFQQLHAEGRTIIFVTHNPEIAQYSSRNITLRDGHITGDTRNEHILSAAEALARLPKQEDY